MLRDVDTSLAAWLVEYLPPGAGVVFDAPDQIRDGHQPAGTALGLFLHEVREEAEITPADWSSVRGDGGQVIGRLPPQRRYRLTYLMTAWAGDRLTEHELLGNVLAGCAVHHIIPTSSLQGCLVDAGQPVMIRCAPFDRGCDPRELWAAWRIPPRTALELSVLAPLPITALTTVPPAPRRLELNSARKPPPLPRRARIVEP